MKAIVWTRYGPPDSLKLREVEKPVPRDNEVLVSIRAATVTTGDCELRNLKGPVLFRLAFRMYLGWSRPRRITILGQELAGEIEATGKAVKRFREGHPILAYSGLRLGAYAEYTCLPDNGMLAMKPANLTYEEAATIPLGGLEALHSLRKANVQSGEKVLIVGAGGSIGTYGVQLGKYFGAEVTGVDSTGKLDMLRSIGADHVIDYTKEDFTESGETYDVIYDAVGKSPFSGSLRSLKQNGRLLLGNPSLSQRIRGQWAPITGGRTVVLWTANRRTEDLVLLGELMAAGKIRSVIDRRYPLEQTAEAHRYVDTGQKKGNVVIIVEHSSQT